MIDYEKLKGVIFKLDPELAHMLAENLLIVGSKVPYLLDSMISKNFITDGAISQSIFGREFLNPVGLAAGFDKNCTMIDGLYALGFGFVEIGTITPLPQVGNSKPRLFRHIKESSLQNGMGFNNDGALKVKSRLKKCYPNVIPLGVNIGKNKNQNDALKDYIDLIREFEALSDYLVINVSSPNTPNLRDLLNIDFIKELLSRAKEITNKPIAIKLSPDITIDSALELSSVAVESGASAIIATNTTVDYSLVENPKDFGGISGSVLKKRSQEMLAEISKILFDKTTIISVGGIDSKEEAFLRLELGASLIQIYSSLVFNGPSFVREINEYILEMVKASGASNIKEIIGRKR